MFTQTSKLFYDEFTGTGGGGSTYLNSCTTDKITCVIEGYFKWSVENARFLFDASDKTIIILAGGQSTVTSFIDAEFRLGDTITISGSVFNNGNFTITALTDTIMTVMETVIDETAESANIFGTTLISAMDFYYNLIENSAAIDFISTTDNKTFQKYTVDGLDASVATPVFMKVATDSYGWVTDTLTGEVSEVKIEGEGIASFKQSFKITQVFYQTRIWTVDLFGNFNLRSIPDEFTNGKHLNHICKIDGKYNLLDPIIVHSATLNTPNGITAWFNQNSIGSRPEYTIGSIAYSNNITSDPLDQILSNTETLVTLVVKSRSGKFVTASTQLLLSHFQCPKTTSDYINTETTLLQNINLDNKLITCDDASTNGNQFGTDYQSLTNIQSTFIDANTIIITFVVNYSNAIKSYLENKIDSNRYYAIILSTQDESITTTINTDRINILCDFNNAQYDLRESDNFGLIDYIHCFPYPQTILNENNNIAGIDGDPHYVTIPFWLETAVIDSASPTLKNISIQIVATKEGCNDFVLEEKLFDTSNIPKVGGVQDIEIELQRGFILADDSFWNRCNIIRVPANDDGTKMAYELQYAGVLRYEDWITNDLPQNNSANTPTVQNDIKDIVQEWERYSQGFGWALLLRLTVNVQGYNGLNTIFKAETDMLIYNSQTLLDSGPVFVLEKKYYNEANTQLLAIDKENKTRLLFLFTGDVSTFPGSTNTHYGWIFQDNYISGTSFLRRFASNVIDSESDSPFTTEGLPGILAQETATGILNYDTPVVGDRVTIGTRFWIYSLPAAEWMGINPLNSDPLLINAINGDVLCLATANVISPTQLLIQAKTGGAAGNSIVTTNSPVRVGFFWDDATLLGGVDGALSVVESDNLRLAVYDDRVELDCFYYDPEKLIEGLIIACKLGFYQN